MNFGKHQRHISLEGRMTPDQSMAADFLGRCQATPPVLQQPAVRCRSVVINDYKSVCCVRSQDFATDQSRKLEESGSPWSATQVYVNI